MFAVRNAPRNEPELKHPIRIVVADDHVALRESLASFLDSQPDIDVVAQASTGPEAAEKSKALLPDVLLIDITMPGCSGIRVIEALSHEHPSIRCVALTMHEDHQFLQSVLAAGGFGYVTKRAASSELLNALREVARGRSYIQVSMSDQEAQKLAEPPPDRVTLEGNLSAREKQVLSLVAHGYTSKEIAQKLSLSPASVDTYRVRIFEKLGTRQRADLVQYALRTGLLGNCGPEEPLPGGHSGPSA